MTAQRRLGLDLSWSWITPAFLIDVVILVLVTRYWPDSWQHAVRAWWVGAAVALVATLIGLVTYRGITVASALAAWLWDWSADPEAVLTTGCAPAVDHRRRFGRDVVGVREYRDRLVAVIALKGPVNVPVGRHARREVPADSVPVDAIAAALCQFDVRLEGIDVVSVRTRHLADVAGPSPTTDDPIDGDQRNTWVILRMDPQRNVGAMAARDSVASTLAAATERLADALGGRRYAPRPLTADEIAEVDAAVLAGLQPTWSRPGWRHLKHINGYATSFWVSPRDITSDMLDQLWLPNTDATVLTVRITTRGGRPEVSAWVRYHSSGQLPKDMCAGLNRLTGRQLAAVRASLPAPTRRSRLVVPAGALGDSEPLAVRVEPAPGSPPQESIVLAE